MRPIRAAAITVAMAAIPAVAVVVFTQEAVGHGTMGTPVSRVYQCYLEGPEAPKSAACKQAVAIGGTQPLYDWNEINQANALPRALTVGGGFSRGGRPCRRARSGAADFGGRPGGTRTPNQSVMSARL